MPFSFSIKRKKERDGKRETERWRERDEERDGERDKNSTLQFKTSLYLSTESAGCVGGCFQTWTDQT